MPNPIVFKLVGVSGSAFEDVTQGDALYIPELLMER